MINTVYILFFQLILMFYLFLLIFYEVRVLYFGSIIIFFQVTILLLAITNRALGSGFTMLFFLYVVTIPVILPYILKKLSKRNPQSLLKILSLRFQENLDNSFFNLLLFNKGLFYFSRKFFQKNEQFFREALKTPHTLKNFFILYPWIFFITFLIFEMVVYEKIYLSAILLSINILIYRFFLLLLRIIEYSCIEALICIDSQFFSSTCKKPLPSFFLNSTNILKIMDNNESSQEEYLLHKWKICYSAITYSSSYFSAYVLKKYLCFYYRNILNCITLLVVLFGNLLQFSEKFFISFVPLVMFFTIYFFSFFILRNKFSTIDSLIKHLFAVRLSFAIFRNNLVESNLVSYKNIFKNALIVPPVWQWKPQSFSEYFQGFEFQNFEFHFFKKPFIFNLLTTSFFYCIKFLKRKFISFRDFFKSSKKVN